MDQLFEKIDTNGDGVIDKEELVAAIKNDGEMEELFDPDADSDADSDEDTEIESENESDEESEQESDEDNAAVTETIVIDGKDYEVDGDNNVYAQDDDGDWFRIGVLIDGELVKDN